MSWAFQMRKSCLLSVRCGKMVIADLDGRGSAGECRGCCEGTGQGSSEELQSVAGERCCPCLPPPWASPLLVSWTSPKHLLYFLHQKKSRPGAVQLSNLGCFQQFSSRQKLAANTGFQRELKSSPCSAFDAEYRKGEIIGKSAF